MAPAVQIPGRRVTDGETFYTDWSPRGGDCIILRVEVMKAAGGASDKLNFALETRGEDGTTVTTITPTTSTLVLSTAGLASCLYLAGASTGGAKEQVRVKVFVNGGDGGYFVTRIFPLIFFDNAKP